MICLQPTWGDPPPSCQKWGLPPLGSNSVSPKNSDNEENDEMRSKQRKEKKKTLKKEETSFNEECWANHNIAHQKIINYPLICILFQIIWPQNYVATCHILFFMLFSILLHHLSCLDTENYNLYHWFFCSVMPEEFTLTAIFHKGFLLKEI